MAASLFCSQLVLTFPPAPICHCLLAMSPLPKYASLASCSCWAPSRFGCQQLPRHHSVIFTPTSVRCNHFHTDNGTNIKAVLDMKRLLPWWWLQITLWEYEEEYWFHKHILKDVIYPLSTHTNTHTLFNSIHQFNTILLYLCNGEMTLTAIRGRCWLCSRLYDEQLFGRL